MARKQATTPNTTPTTSSDTVPQYQGSSGPQPQQPIGVPYYAINPDTGQPYPDNRRWGAYVDSNPQGSEGTQGPGTASSYGHLPGSGQQMELPRYFDGDQWVPASLPPDQLAMLQKKMVSAGLLKSGEAQLGIWDTASMGAYTKLLAYANASGMDSVTALDRWGQQHILDPNAGKAPLQVHLSDPGELAQVFRAAVISTRGEGWATDKINQMVAAYQGVERTAQTQAYGMQDTGGTVVQPPSPTSFAQTQVRKEDPLGAQEHDVIGQGGPLDAFRQMLGGWQ